MAGLSRRSKGGNWDTGIVEHEREFFIFANIGTEGRTGHDYGNRWEGDQLRWFHKSGSRRAWSSVQRLLEPGRTIHVFWRSSNAELFEYAGAATATDIVDTSPVEILWSFDRDEETSGEHWLIRNPEELPMGGYREGTTHQVLVNAYERNRAARQACIAHFGPACSACGLQFEEQYGSLGVGFIHVHHIVPLASLGPDYEVNPIKDLRPVCPNCHAMLHRRQPPLSLDELRALIRVPSQ